LASKKPWQVHMSLPAGTRFGPYEIRALIGSGGMGEVYRATDTRLGRDVAIKTLRAGTTSRDRLDRFEQEARATAALNHPNIVVVFDVGVFDGAPYVVSELLDGLTIRERMRHGETVPVVRRSTIASRSHAGWRSRIRAASRIATSSRRTSSSRATAS
jgi:serine/threonine protein kinase